MKKTLLVTIVTFVSLSVNAQIFKGRRASSDDSESRFVRQVDMYLQDQWGVGFSVRKESSPHFGWNLIGASYMSGWYDCNRPKNFSIINARLMGLRFNLPIKGNFKFYVEGMPGYSYVYKKTTYMDYDWGYEVTKTRTDKSHCFGLDCGAGFQILRNLSVGYNYTFLATINDNTDNYHIHWARVSFLF